MNQQLHTYDDRDTGEMLYLQDEGDIPFDWAVWLELYDWAIARFTEENVSN